MDKKYLNYNVDDLLQDKAFVAWVLHGKERHAWEHFFHEYPLFKAEALQARKIILLLQDSESYLEDDDIYSIWMNVDQFDRAHRQTTKRLVWQRIAAYAAVFVVGIMGVLLLYNYGLKPPVYEFSATENVMEGSRILLSNGKQIDLKKTASSVRLDSAASTLTINNEEVVHLQQAETNVGDEGKMNEVIIPFGKKSELVLEDGTKVCLNAGSRLAFPNHFSGEKREIFLDGEAYLEVTHDARKPFFVNAGGINVKVLGTKFDISAYSKDDLIETVLLEGKVALSEHSALGFLKKDVNLLPGQRGTYDKSSKNITVKDEPNAELTTAWREGWFQFSHESLLSVFRRLERYYNVSFSYDKNFPVSDLITGKLDLKESLQDVMLALSDVAKIRYRITGDVVIVDVKLEELPMRK